MSGLFFLTRPSSAPGNPHMSCEMSSLNSVGAEIEPETKANLKEGLFVSLFFEFLFLLHVPV